MKAVAQVIHQNDMLPLRGWPSGHDGAQAAAERFVAEATAIVRAGRRPSDYDKRPAPLYATDADGAITYFNAACVEFAGRVPKLGVDRWCVSWKLHYDDGVPLAHDQCPMAVALREERPVRGVEAVAERPDGGRRRFRPFPTPVTNDEGKVIGAINLLVPTDGEAQRDLLNTATKCRRLAQWVTDEATNATLAHMADEYEDQAAVLSLV